VSESVIRAEADTMDIKKLKESIKEKELRLSQLRSMDTHKLLPQDKALIESLEKEINQLKEQLGEE
jgi:hypothetical protein